MRLFFICAYAVAVYADWYAQNRMKPHRKIRIVYADCGCADTQIWPLRYICCEILAPTMQKVKAQILIHMKLFGTDEKLLKDPGENLSVQILSKMWSQPGVSLWAKPWRAWLTKLKFCTEANQTLLLKRLQNKTAQYYMYLVIFKAEYNLYSYLAKKWIWMTFVFIFGPKNTIRSPLTYIINSLFPGFLHDFFFYFGSNF